MCGSWIPDCGVPQSQADLRIAAVSCRGFVKVPFRRKDLFDASVRLTDRVLPATAGWMAHEMFCRPHYHPVAKTPPAGASCQAHRFEKATRLLVPYTYRARLGQITAHRFASAHAPVGRRRAVILVHGWSSAAKFMLAFIEPLNRRGYDVICFDFPAHGASSRKRTTLAECAHAFRALVQATPDLHAIVAHSFGGPVTALTCEGGTPLPGPVAPPPKIVTIASPNTFLSVTRHFGRTLGLSPRAQAVYEGKLERLFNRPLEELTSENFLRPVKSDVLVMHCRDDEDVHFSEAEQIARLEHVRLVALSGLGHRRVLYTPKVVNEALRFLGPNR